jgi:hypothetical protein
VPDLFFFNVLF